MTRGSGGARALVLGGGGIAGLAWEIGLLSGLAVQGVDLRGADLVVGTSAGSVAGALLRSGRDLEELYAAQLEPVPAGEPAVEFDVLTLMSAIGAAMAGAAGEQGARARVGEFARSADTVTEADRRAAIASRIGDPPWPAQRLVVTAVDTGDGAFNAFDADAGVTLLDAVTASCAVPGIWPPITIGERRYMDGGMRSATNADLAAGCGRVLVVAPVQGASDNPLGPGFPAELDSLRRNGAVHVVVAGEAARAAFGTDPLDPRTREPSARAGRAQADAELAEVGEFWGMTADAEASRGVVGEPELVEAEVLGTPVSVLVAHADRPRAVVFALHGGASGKEYFDHPLDPSLSLLRLGPLLGFTVVAPDRPGYVPDDGASAMPPERRTDLLYAVLDSVLVGRARGAGVLVLAHSMGSISGIRMAADERGRQLLGLDFSGTGLRWAGAVHAATAAGDGRLGGNDLGRLIWGPRELYPPGARRALPLRGGPQSEGYDTEHWGGELPRIAPRVAVPVRYTLAEHEAWWESGREALAEVAALFTAAPVVETAIETGAGHNVSLGWTARAYHLRVLAFAEQCIARRAVAGPAPGPR